MTEIEELQEKVTYLRKQLADALHEEHMLTHELSVRRKEHLDPSTGELEDATASLFRNMTDGCLEVFVVIPDGERADLEGRPDIRIWVGNELIYDRGTIGAHQERDL